MPTYRSRLEVTAVRWWQNGDWPTDGVGEPRVDQLSGETYRGIEGAVVRFYRTPPHVPGFKYDWPETLGDQIHPRCGRTWHEHGRIDQEPTGVRVCPGDWVVQMRGRFLTLSDEQMRERFEVPE